MTIFIQGIELRPDDKPKADALIQVVSKSTCSLDDAVKLADALGIKLHFIASSKPEPKETI